MIGIIEYGSGNVAAIGDIYKRLKVDYSVTSDPMALEECDRFVLPGVGAFDATMEYLRRSGLLEALEEQVLTFEKKVLGICVGMQILASSSDEGTGQGLGWIDGRVRKIDAAAADWELGLPHMGWNSISATRGSELLRDVDEERGFYFLHSYFFDASNDADVIAEVTYGRAMPCALAHRNIFGVQFHPEKSHGNGIAVFRNFAGL